MSVEDIYQNTLLLIAKGNKKGYGYAVQLLTYWLNGNGGEYALSKEIFNNKTVKKGIEETYDYFSEDNPKQLKNIYANIAKGVFEFDEHWDRVKTFDPILDRKDYLAFGTATITSYGKISVKDDGKYYNVTVTVTENRFHDEYNWNNNQGTGYGYFSDSVEDSAMRKLEGAKSYGAKPFVINSYKPDNKVINYKIPK